VNNVGKSVYILGSDYIWPRRSTEILRTAFEERGGKVVAAEFVPFGTQDFGPIFGRIRAAKPDVVWFMVAGADALTALQQYRSFGLTPQIVSNGLDEAFSFANPALTEGTISNQAYFMTLDTPENQAFRKAYGSRFGENTPINAIGEATYDAVWMYARAVEKAGSTDVEAVRKALREVDFQAPQGHIDFSQTNNCLRTNSLIARGQADGHCDIIQNVGQIDPEVPNCTISL
jgi:urea transport system substrate-binding protein